MMHISDKGLNLIKKFEGLRLKAYKCPAGKLSIGYGHTNNVRPDDVITEAQAVELLIRDVFDVEGVINRLVTKTLTQGQFDALCSFIFNLGAGNFQRSTLLRKINQGDFVGASREFSRWIYAGGKVLNGLKVRRQAEKDLFNS
jgi:lysozyme